MSESPMRLMGTGEIALCFGGISRQRVSQLTRRATFPAPIACLNQGKVWHAEEVEAWASVYRRHQEGSVPAPTAQRGTPP
ncbi:putative DNA-binding transcriptional regulator AlpA [Actinoplanes couchii]|uniref:Uncharacterized protein n=1 Tax=Actinoplanes couchii TaxID=403638 RepID=A0ABQ3XP85_9ACTN|nr:putative DNA-binding transcriptional regulator AlpA [Actinoplanes couchii]GID60225.1 hypothetical protein Aco03nite_086290 [Actinoplanes couchii]